MGYLVLLLINIAYSKYLSLPASQLEDYISSTTDIIRFVSFCSSSISPCLLFQDQYYKISVKHPNYEMISIDIVDEESAQIASNYELEGYPHLVFYPKDTKDHITYTGSFEPADIEAAMSRISENLHEFKSLDEFRNAISEKYYVDGLVLGVFSKKNKRFDMFMAIAEGSKHINPFAYTFSDEFSTEYNVRDGVIIARPHILVSRENDGIYLIKNMEDIEKLSEEITNNFYGPVA